jgi:zinc protease
MRKITPLLVILLIAAFASYFYLTQTKPLATQVNGTVAHQAWPQLSSDIPSDKKAVFGSLANGMRYIIYPNKEPQKRFSVRLRVAAGSLMEADDQQGLAHFLEHMVFNGTKNFTPDQLVPKMQRLGISFGAHVNAYTSFDETVYMLDLPDLSADTNQLAFTVMRDFADGASLLEKEIDKERGVISSEKISRDSVQYRLMQKQFSQLLPDSLIPKRFPIGLDEVIKTAPRDRFVDLYSRYYTPSRMTFIVVGDIDPKEIEEKIQQTFSSMKNPETPGKEPTLGSIKAPQGVQAAVFSDKELTSTELSLMSIKSYEKKPDTIETRASRIPIMLAHKIISRRLERLSKEENSSIISGLASRSVLFNFAELGSIDVTARDNQWKEALPILEQEFRRALQFGFTEAELTESKAKLLNAYEQAVKALETRKSESLASSLASSINDDSVFSTPETDLEITKKAFDSIDLQSCSKAFQEFWKDDAFHLVITTQEETPSMKDDLTNLYQESKKTSVTAPSQIETKKFAYETFGQTGIVTNQKDVADLSITQLALSNGIRVNLKKTDFAKNSISIRAQIQGGQLTMPNEKPGLDDFASFVFNAGGLGQHSSDELEQIFAGKNVSSKLSVEEDSFAISGKTTPEDLKLQLQLMCASIVDPGYRAEGINQYHAMLPQLEQQLKYSPAGPKTEIESWMHDNDPRFTTPPIDTLSLFSVDDAKQWLSPALQQNAMELSIIGDFDKETIIPLLLETFGSLANRSPSPRDLNVLRQVKFPITPSSKDTSYISKVPQAIAIINWRMSGLRDYQKESRRFNIVASILNDRLREEIREKLGASYGPKAGVGGSTALENFGYVSAMTICKPEDLTILTKTITEIGQKFANSGATQDELDRALKPTMAEIEKSVRDNNYWLSTVIASCQEKPESLDLARTRSADYASISLNEVNELAKKYFNQNNALTITIQSKAE